MLLLSEEDANHEIAKTEQFIERGPKYTVQYLVELERKRFLCVAFSWTYPDFAKAFVIDGSAASQNARRDITNVKTERMADGGTVAYFTEDVGSDEISKITLCLDIPSPLSADDRPALILDRKKERIVRLYDENHPKLSNEEKRGTTQFANVYPCVPKKLVCRKK